MRSFITVLFSSLAVLDPRVGHTRDVLSPFLSVILIDFHGQSCTSRLDGFMTHVTRRLTARTGISSGTLRSVIEYGLPFTIKPA